MLLEGGGVIVKLGTRMNECKRGKKIPYESRIVQDSAE